MLTRLSKMLMSAEGGSPGGGSAPAGTGAPAAPAQGAAPAATLTLDQVKAVVNEAVTATRNGIFADLRKSGVYKGGKEPAGDPPAGDDGGKSAGGTAPAPGVSADDVTKLIHRATAFERVATETKLTDAQRKRMDAAMRAENPDDVAAWSKAYLEDMGIAKANPSTTTTNPNGGAPAGAAAPRGPSMSDRGAPGRDGSIAHDGQVWKMTPAEVQALIKEKGFQGAAHELRARLRQDLKGVRLLFPRPGS